LVLCGCVFLFVCESAYEVGSGGGCWGVCCCVRVGAGGCGRVCVWVCVCVCDRREREMSRYTPNQNISTHLGKVDHVALCDTVFQFN